MPPEQAPFVAILDLRKTRTGVDGTVFYEEPEDPAGEVRVRWGVGSPPTGFEAVAGGLLFVKDHKDEKRAPETAPSLSYEAGDEAGEETGELMYSEGFAGAPWMGMYVFLPVGYELVDATPKPRGSRLVDGRLGVYWRLREEPAEGPLLKGTLRPLSNMAEALRATGSERPGGFHKDDDQEQFDFFVSYRRTDSWPARWITEAFTSRFGEAAMFRDEQSIRLGADFRTEIDEAIQQCRILLCLVGQDWLDLDLPRDERRIFSDEDWPRIEVEKALQLERAVVPVFLDEAPIPTKEDLPDSLEQLAYSQGFRVRVETAEDDLRRLCERLLPRER